METCIPGIYAAGDVCQADWGSHSKHWFQMRLWTQVSWKRLVGLLRPYSDFYFYSIVLLFNYQVNLTKALQIWADSINGSTRLQILKVEASRVRQLKFICTILRLCVIN